MRALDKLPSTQRLPFERMLTAAQAELAPKWLSGFGLGGISFIAGWSALMLGLPWIGADRIGGTDVSPYLILVMALMLMALGLWQRDILKPVTVYGLMVNGKPERLVWPKAYDVRRGNTTQADLLAMARTAHPNAKVELVPVGEGRVYVPRRFADVSLVN